MKKQVLLFFALLCPVFAFCQGIRYDTPPILNSSGKPISGAVISLCPGTATISGSTCSPATAQGFTSITLGTACSVGSPVVLTGLNTCQATSDTLGNAGFWLSPGAYIYCINAPSQIGQCYNLTVPIGVTASGNVNISPNSFTAGSIPSPGPIGGTTPSTGTFTSATITGALTGTTASFANPGVFTGTTFQGPVTSAINSINFNSEYQASEGANGDSVGFAGGVVISSSSTIHEVNGVFGAVQNNSTATNGVGVRGQCRSVVNGTPCWGAVVVADSATTLTSGVSLIGEELDVGIQSPLSAYTGAFGYSSVIGGQTSGTIGGSTAFLASGNSVGSWSTGFRTVNGFVSGKAFYSGATCSSGSCNSAGIQLDGLLSGATNSAVITANSSGAIVMAPASLGSIQLQGYLAPGEQAAPGALGAGFDQLWGDSTAHRMKMINNGGSADTVVGAATTDTFTNKSTAAGPLTGTVASGTAALTTAAITAGNCGTTVTVAAANVLTTDTITWAFNAAPAGSNAGVVAWPTSGNVNFAYCPNTAETPAAATVNWRVIR